MLYERTLGQWLEHWAETTPDKEYIVYSDRNLRFTWSQFNHRVLTLPRMSEKKRAAVLTREFSTGGADVTRLADSSLCLRQDRCRLCNGKHKL